MLAELVEPTALRGADDVADAGDDGATFRCVSERV
eukprot:SAG11_NODE_6637_length_1275_cov_2.623299_1_plen_34_part_10